MYSQRGTNLTFSNAWNQGFAVDGNMSPMEANFNETFSPWEMVQGPSGTYLRIIDLDYDLENWFGVDSFMRSWYYDNSKPIGSGDFGAPQHPNGWSLCSATLDGQVMKRRLK